MKQITVDYDQLVVQLNDKESTSRVSALDFPSPETTNSYNRPNHLPIRGSVPIEDSVDPTQFLPSHNPEIAKRKNPLRKTPANNIGLEWSVTGMHPDEKAFIDKINNVIFNVRVSYVNFF